MPRPKKVVPTITSNAHITLSLSGKVYEGKGETLLDALNNLPHPQKIVAKGFLSVTQGDKKKDITMLPARLKHFFFPVARNLWAKRLDVLLK